MPETRAAARRALLAAALLAAAALVGTTGWSHWRLTRQAQSIAQSQGVRLGQEVHDALDGEAVPDDAALQAVRDGLGAEEVHWIAVLEGDGAAAVAGGKRVLDASLPTPGEVDVIRGEGVGVIVASLHPQRPEGPQDVTPPKTYRVAFAFEPSLALALQRQSRTTMLIAVVVAVLLLGFAAAAYRSWVRADAAEASAVESRHLASLGQVSAVMAHEIRNPLAALKGHAQLLAEVLDEHPRLERRAIRVVGEAVRLEKITNDLLDFARTAALHRSPADPVALARAVAVDTDPARVRVDADRAPGAWSLDADKLRQVLLNVVQNALAIDKAGGPVEVAVTVSDRELRLTVRDHGPGLPAGEVEQLFQPFFTTRTKGTGLGLPVSRRIARLHGGDLLAANHPDGGAVFTITIPEDPHGATAGRR